VDTSEGRRRSHDPTRTRASVPPPGEALALYEQITTGPRANGPQQFPLTRADGSLTAPFGALLSARLGKALQAVGAAIRYERR
jgi:hypothetical protein